MGASVILSDDHVLDSLYREKKEGGEKKEQRNKREKVKRNKREKEGEEKLCLHGQQDNATSHYTIFQESECCHMSQSTSKVATHCTSCHSTLYNTVYYCSVLYVTL